MLFNPQLENLTLSALQVLIGSYVYALTEEGFTVAEALEVVKKYIFQKDLKVSLNLADSIFDS